MISNIKYKNPNKQFRKLTLVSGAYRGRRMEAFVYLPLNDKGRPQITQKHLCALFAAQGINMHQHTTFSYGC